MDAQTVNVNGSRICVAGLGVSGTAAARVLAEAGAEVTVVESRRGEAERERAGELARLGVRVRFGDVETAPPGTELIVTSPGWSPASPLLRGEIPVIGEVELAWRLRPEKAAPWLCVTGTNGKTTAVRMLAAMLTAAGHRALAVGNVGTPIVEAVHGDHDVLAVELSSFQLHWSATLAPHASAVLNLAPDHVDWHGSVEAYAEAKARVFERAGHVVHNADDTWSSRLAEPYRGSGAQVVGCTLAVPRPGQFGIVEDLLVDRAYVENPAENGTEIATFADIRPLAPHNVANALAAGALARSFGVPPDAIALGLRGFVPDPHRMAAVGRAAGLDWVDDSKATNPHAAAASLAAYPSIVWIAGGLIRGGGSDLDDVVRRAAPRLRAAVLIGTDRAKIHESLARHAPDVPVIELAETDTSVMDRVVTEAVRLAAPGDTVLLAPAAASLDMFTDYKARGEAFAAAVRRLP
ncbi:UDP-N-acetylmuramoyl-L-alanine--D-glutamate ligase [Rhizohabitans arisaemae]|uniref:UDP-N-acetylmuramoyl-L-alanine--D-glutamate ligase n=1 Tax=Rhizohabitans arisaemae TaxID=2720610 RepID=UPI0024B243EB|nr:UDP-N-acetylmuramoyl-L-alanine--D-glutamate ligase [Rhizohabitans arisaemae]